MNSVREFLSRIKWITIAMILAGLLIDVMVVPKNATSKWYELLFHIGETLVIAGLVGLVLELTEFARYFEERLSHLFEEEQFLQLFSPQKLELIGKKALRLSKHKEITNPQSRWEDFLGVVVQEILPMFTENYRANYREIISVAIEEFPSAVTGAPRPQASLIKTVYEYDVISPRNGNQQTKYCIATQAILTKVPGLDRPECYYSAELSIDGNPVPLDGKLRREIKGEEVHVGFSHEFPIKGTAHVKISMKEYDLIEEGSNSVSIKMRTLTQNATVAFSCVQPVRLRALVYGLSSKEIKSDATDNMVIFSFPGWMLPGDGFQIDYWLNSKTVPEEVLADGPSYPEFCCYPGEIPQG